MQELSATTDPTLIKQVEEELVNEQEVNRMRQWQVLRQKVARNLLTNIPIINPLKKNQKQTLYKTSAKVLSPLDKNSTTIVGIVGKGV